MLINLTRLGKEKRDLSKDRVLTFNEVIKQHIPQEKLDAFIEVAEKITS